jgi:hypothetical protein
VIYERLRLLKWGGKECTNSAECWWRNLPEKDYFRSHTEAGNIPLLCIVDE